MKMTVDELRSVISKGIPHGLVVPEHDETGHYYRHTETDEKYASVTTKAGILEAPHLKRWAASEAVKYIDKHWDTITTDNKEEVFKAAVLAHQDQFEEAGDIGSEGHDIVDKYLKQWMKTGVAPKDITKLIVGEDYRLWAISRSAEMFCKDFNVLPLASEMYVASTRYKFGGTLDSIMLVARIVRKGDSRCEHNWMWSATNPLAGRCVECDRKFIQEPMLVDWKTSNSIDKPEYAMQVSAYWWAVYEMTGIRLKGILIVRLDKKQAKYQVMQVVHRPSAFAAFRASSKIYDWLTNQEEKLAPLVAKERISL